MNAPSQPVTPPLSVLMPDYPFQLVATDYFAYGGKLYLVIVERYSAVAGGDTLQVRQLGGVGPAAEGILL